MPFFRTDDQMHGHPMLGRPRADLAREFDVTPARISQISTEALERLREKFREEGLER